MVPDRMVADSFRRVGFPRFRGFLLIAPTNAHAQSEKLACP
jgi:hypothetical protein